MRRPALLVALGLILAAAPATAGEKHLAFGERKTLWTGKARTPVFTLDAWFLFFVAERADGEELVLARVRPPLDTRCVFHAPADARIGEPVASPDNHRVAFIVTGKDRGTMLGAGTFSKGDSPKGPIPRIIPGTEGVTAIRWAADSGSVLCTVEGGQVVWKVGEEKAGEKQLLPEVPGGPYHPVARSPDGQWCTAAKFVASPKTGIVRPAGLYLWPTPGPGDAKVEVKELLSPDDWLIGVYDTYAGTTSWSLDSKKIRFVGARLEPEPGKPYRPLCVWEVLREGGEPVKLYEYGWWPKRFWMSWGGHGLCAWRYDIDPAMYATDLATGETLRFEGRGGLSKNRFAFAPGCRAVAILSKAGLDLVEIKIVEAPAPAPPPEEKEEKNE